MSCATSIRSIYCSARERMVQVRQVAEQRSAHLNALYDAVPLQLQSNHLFHDSPDFVASLRALHRAHQFSIGFRCLAGYEQFLRLTLLFVVLVPLLALVRARADDWPQWRGLNRDGHQGDGSAARNGRGRPETDLAGEGLGRRLLHTVGRQ